MRKTARNILGAVALVALSAGVAGVTTYKLLPKESTASTFADTFQQNAAYHIYGSDADAENAHKHSHSHFIDQRRGNEKRKSHAERYSAFHKTDK